MERPVIILGAGGLGKVALDIFNTNDIMVYCFLDDNPDLLNTEFNGVSVLGNTEDEEYLKLLGKDCEAFIATDENKLRKSLVEHLNKKKKIMPVNAVHSGAYISEYADIGHGNLIQMGVNIGTNARIGNHTILNSGCIIDHDSNIGDYVQIGPGSIVGPGVEIDESAFIGAGVTLVAGIKIGKNARVGAGSVVVGSVENNATVFGNPAQPIKK